MARWTAIGLLVLAPQLALAQANVSTRVDASQDSVRGVAVNGDYRLYRGRQWAVSASGTLEQSSPGATSLAQALSAQYGFSLGERPATLSLNYGARRDWQGASGLDAGQSGTVDLGWQPLAGAGVGAFGSVSRMNFDRDGADARLDSPDGVTRRAGIRGLLAFDDRRRTLQGTLSYARYDAEGANLVSRAMAAALQYTQLLSRRWSLAAGADYTRTRYTAFVADPGRASAAYGCRLMLQGALMRRLSASFAYVLGRQAWNQDPTAKQESILLSVNYLL